LAKKKLLFNVHYLSFHNISMENKNRNTFYNDFIYKQNHLLYPPSKHSHFENIIKYSRAQILVKNIKQKKKGKKNKKMARNIINFVFFKEWDKMSKKIL
jgi:hypothetical protein